ncbi:MAG: glutathione S-transferase family protein [Oceanococcus sp.]
MQLYSAAISPYASRCRVQIYHKNLAVEIVPPPGGMRSDDVLARNPGGRIPVLDLGDKSLAESWSIMEYLEDTHPDTPMRPSDAFERARISELVRFTDIYLASAMFPLFKALRGGVDEETVSQAMLGLSAQLTVLESQWARKPQSCELDLADAALIPIVWYAQILARHFGNPNCMAGLEQTQAWWTRMNAVPAAAKVLAEMDAGLRAALPVLFE